MWASLAPLRIRFPETRWMRPVLLHLTLVFLGDVDSSRVPDIERGLTDLAWRHPSYATSVNGAGGHVDDRPGARRGGVAWLTLLDGASETTDLALDVDSTIASGTYDARRRPRPHLTVARAIDLPGLAALRDFSDDLALSWRTTTVVLFRSRLGPDGSNYEALSTHDLADA